MLSGKFTNARQQITITLKSCSQIEIFKNLLLVYSFRLACLQKIMFASKLWSCPTYRYSRILKTNYILCKTWISQCKWLQYLETSEQTLLSMHFPGVLVFFCCLNIVQTTSSMYYKLHWNYYQHFPIWTLEAVKFYSAVTFRLPFFVSNIFEQVRM